MPCFYLTPKQDSFNKIPELQVCVAEVLYDVDSIVADPEAYTKDELASLHSQILSNLEQAWGPLGGSEDQLLSTMIQISHVVAQRILLHPRQHMAVSVERDAYGRVSQALTHNLGVYTLP